jgi:pimeloyl-ACP methyl ester carboxylesterase
VRRVVRATALALGVLFVVVTVAAAGYDLATNGRERPARALYRGPYVAADRTLVAYRTWGRGGSPIVLLGGFAEPSSVWNRVGPLLARTHRVYAVDLPPFGYTQRRGPYTLARWVSLVQAFDRTLGIRRPLLVGHSLGAGVAVDSALARPHGVAGIVLLDGDALPVGGPGWISHVLFEPYYSAAFRLVTGSDWIVGKILRNALASDAPKPSAAVIEQWQRPFEVAGTENAFRHLFAGGPNGVTVAELERVRVPRAVVWGVDDTVDSVSAGRETARRLRTPFVLVPHAGHLSMLGNPRAVASAIERVSVVAEGERGR